MINKLLNKYCSCSNPENFDEFLHIINAIDSIDAVEVFTTYCLEHLTSLQVQQIVQQYTFELFNAVYAITVNDSSNFILPEVFATFVRVLLKYAPAREVYLVAAERLLSGTTISALPFTLFSLQASLVGLDSIDAFNAGMFYVQR